MLVPNLADLHITDFDGKYTLTLYVIHLAPSAPDVGIFELSIKIKTFILHSHSL